MRYPVGNDACFTAAGAGQNQQRTFGVGNGLALLGIQPCKEIHEMGDIRILTREQRLHALEWYSGGRMYPSAAAIGAEMFPPGKGGSSLTET